MQASKCSCNVVYICTHSDNVLFCNANEFGMQHMRIMSIICALDVTHTYLVPEFVKNSEKYSLCDCPDKQW